MTGLHVGMVTVAIAVVLTVSPVGLPAQQASDPAIRIAPMGFFAKWVDGRIDDPDAGWKGKGLFSTYATRTPFHVEGGKGTTSKVVKFQRRPDPLAR